MKKILLWDPRFPARDPLRLNVDDAVAGAMVRSGAAAPADQADASLYAGPAVSSAYPVETALAHGASGQRITHVTVPLAVAQLAEAAGLAARIPITPVAALNAIVTRDNGDFLISPIDGQQLMGAN
ncbi:hypothetical protein [Sphingomonas immobilis]|uniref:Uncharacterized protein n=1 Tax=Sphingomonas immobilis TaxID=3063997 RepID=A0ABT8ZU17_9SPHN|nr:hypothetical protein [Sphingomonas sp. CA1-15]MDO7841060.1 hypothetical protein [Sphingomonas sp. CA1-15]